MFGNMVGWMISAVMVVAAVFAGKAMLQMSQPTAVSEWLAANTSSLSPLGLDETAKPILPPMNDLKDDTGDLYRQAVADYENQKARYDMVEKAKSLKEVDYGSLNGLNDLVTAAQCPGMDLFKNDPQEIVGFKTEIPVLDDLQSLATVCTQVALLAKVEKQYDVASKYAMAAWMLGYHLYQERAAYDELSTAESILSAADRLLIDIDEDQNLNDKRAAVVAFDDARKQEYMSKIKPNIEVLRSVDQTNIAEHTGDVYAVAADPDVDRIWRVEAIRRIGRLQFNAENRADQLKAPKVLEKMENDPDPILRATATAAAKMTVADNQCQR